MAEFVQQSVEEMLPELEQMSRVGLFTDEETRYKNIFMLDYTLILSLTPRRRPPARAHFVRRWRRKMTPFLTAL